MPDKLTTQISKRATRFWPVVSGAVALVLAASLGLIITLRASSNLVDAEWMGEIVEHRSPLWDVPAYVMSFIGGGWFGVFLVPISIAVVLALLRRKWAAIYFLVASVVSAGLVQLLKKTLGRSRPEEILIHADFGSFPSGHVANAATIAVALAFILRRVWVWFAGAAYVILMALSRTYLGAHWLSDTIGGALLGAGVAVLVWAPFARRLEAEDPRRSVSSPAGDNVAS